MSEAEQRSQEWLAERCGKFTASKFVDVLARDKRDPSKKLKAWHDLVWKIVVERMTGVPEEGPDGYALAWGRDVEPYGKEAYELETGNVVVETGFIIHPRFDFAGCSPDGLIGTDGALELKSPKSSRVHLTRFYEGMEETHMPQCQGCLWVTDRKWIDFCSYDPRMPESHRLFRQRIERDDYYIGRLEAAVLEAEQEVQKLLQGLRKVA